MRHVIFEKHSSRTMYKLYSILFVLLFSPSFFYVALNAPSMAIGVFFTIFYILVAVKKRFPLSSVRSPILFFLVTTFFLHFIASLISDFQNWSAKHLLSFLLIYLMLISAALLSLEIRKLKPLDLLCIIKSLGMIVIFIGLI